MAEPQTVKMNELPEESQSKEDFYAVGYKGGVSKRINLSMVGDVSEAPADGLYLRARGRWVKYGTPVADTIPEAGLLANVVYEVGQLTGDLAIVLQEPADPTIRNEYTLAFSMGATPFNVILPQGIEWQDGIEPAFEADTTYEIDIINNRWRCIAYRNSNTMKEKITIKPGDCFLIDGTDLLPAPLCLSIAETISGYILYKSSSCKSRAEGEAAWVAAAGGVPAGWKACSEAIPANTQHDVYDLVGGTYLFLRGFTDAAGVIITY